MNRHFQTSGLVNRKLIDKGNADRLRNEAGFIPEPNVRLFLLEVYSDCSQV